MNNQCMNRVKRINYEPLVPQANTLDDLFDSSFQAFDLSIDNQNWHQPV